MGLTRVRAAALALLLGAALPSAAQFKVGAPPSLSALPSIRIPLSHPMGERGVGMRGPLLGAAPTLVLPAAAASASLLPVSPPASAPARLSPVPSALPAAQAAPASAAAGIILSADAPSAALEAPGLVDASGRPFSSDPGAAKETAERLARIFDGSGRSLPSDGEEAVEVRPRLATGPEGEAPALRAKVAELASDVRRALPALRESVALGGWNGPGTTLDSRACGDAAPKLALLLRGMGHPVHAVEAEFHYYALYDGREGQVLIDPTFRQFFGGTRAPPEIPTVFVGTVADLHRFFREHAAAKTTRYAPDRIYFREGRVRDDRVRDLVREGGADLAPIVEYLQDAPPVRAPSAPGILIAR